MTGTLIDSAAKRMAGCARGVYREPNERAALRCGIGDAAGLCDSIARWIGEQNHRKLGGGVTKRGKELQAIAKLCGDEIWKMRDLI